MDHPKIPDGEDDRLTCFLYRVLRDYIPFGSAERVMADLGKRDAFLLTEVDMAEYARTLGKRILEGGK